MTDKTKTPNSKPTSKTNSAHLIRRQRFHYPLSLAAWIIVSVCLLNPETVVGQTNYNPRLLTYAELEGLYRQEDSPAPLQSKLQQLLTTPFVDNSASASGVRPHLPRTPQLGYSIRVAFWNIERGLEYDAIEAAFTDAGKFARLINKTKYPVGSEERRLILKQAELLRAADIVVLNEVDWGLKRTEYRNTVARLAATLRMNYAFGVEFVELTPVALSMKEFALRRAANDSKNDRKRLAEIQTQEGIIKEFKVNPAQYKGLHGTAILSRYPLSDVRLVPFEHRAYDWYESEKEGVSLLEQGKRRLAGKVFLEEVTREVRRGGRTMLIADVTDPVLPEGKITIVATHLESRTKPDEREKQLKELLAQIKDVTTPVVLAGDMNTSTQDATPTSLNAYFGEDERDFRRIGSSALLVQRVEFLSHSGGMR